MSTPSIAAHVIHSDLGHLNDPLGLLCGVERSGCVPELFPISFFKQLVHLSAHKGVGLDGAMLVCH